MKFSRRRSRRTAAIKKARRKHFQDRQETADKNARIRAERDENSK
jgi:hypothetical protein